MDAILGETPKPEWYTAISPREQAKIDHARAYAAQFSAAGDPSHNAYLLIAKLADLLDGAPNRSLLTPAEPTKLDPTRPPDVSKKPGGFA